MNSCESYQELISRLVDGEISHDEHEALMAHMKTCSRCNAMYAVFHDLSDILSEDTEPLPEGLHENIMAGVRRSDIVRKNRRMRRLGLRTALTAAACLVLVLFAATTITPRMRGENVAVRSEEALSVLEAPAAPSPAVSAAPSPEAVSMAPAVPAPAENAAANVRTEATQPSAVSAAPIQNTAPQSPDAYLAAGDSTETQYNTQQPVQEFFYQPAAPQEVYTPAAPQEVYTPVTPQEVYTPMTPQEVYTPAPAQIFSAPAPAQYAEQAPAEAEDAAPAVPETSALRRAADAVPSVPEETVSAPAAVEEPEKEILVIARGISDQEVFDAAPDWETETEADGDPAIWEVVPDGWVEDAGIEAVEPEEAETDTPEEPAEKPAEKKADEQRLSIRGKEARGKLLALLGGGEEPLPEEAELTRVIHLTLVPEDAYSGEEKLDVNVYGDFVFYRLYPAEGGSRSYRAACSLADLDACLKNLSAAPTPTPAPTQDPYIAEIPAA